MLDAKGVDRGFCMECGEEECDEYLPKADLLDCGYCGCPPTKHKKILAQPPVVDDAPARAHAVASTSGCSNRLINETIDDDPANTVIDDLDLSINEVNEDEDCSATLLRKGACSGPSKSGSKKVAQVLKRKKAVSQKLPIHKDSNKDDSESDSGASDEDNGQRASNSKRQKKSSNSGKTSKKGIKIPTTKPTGSKAFLDLGPIPLPKLSSDVLKVLRDPKKDIFIIWRKLINESAAHYNKYKIGNNGHFRLIGEKMVASYPRIGFSGEGKHAWTRFSSDLSSKVRKLRLKDSMNAKERETGTLFPNISVIYQERPERKDQRKEDYPRSNHRSMEFLALELAKSPPSLPKITDYIRDTYDIRTELIKSNVRMPVLLANHEFLMESRYFQIEAALFFGDDKFDSLKSNISRLISALAAVENSTPIQGLDNLQTQLVKKDPIIVITHDPREFGIELPDAKNLSESAQNKDFPKLIVRCGDNGIEELALTFFGRCMTGIESLSVGMVNIISIYLMFDIKFPMQAEKFMDLLECVVLGLPRTGFSVKWRKYIFELCENA